jgi:hypothetical protein
MKNIMKIFKPYVASCVRQIKIMPKKGLDEKKASEPVKTFTGQNNSLVQIFHCAGAE